MNCILYLAQLAHEAALTCNLFAKNWGVSKRRIVWQIFKKSCLEDKMYRLYPHMFIRTHFQPPHFSFDIVGLLCNVKL